MKEDEKFNQSSFKSFKICTSSQIKPDYPHHYQKLAFVSNPVNIRFIYIEILEADTQTDDKDHISQSAKISKRLDGSDIMNIYELTHSFRKPLLRPPKSISDGIPKAKNTIEIKRKLMRIYRYRTPTIISIELGVMLEVYFKIAMETEESSSPLAQRWEIIRQLLR